MIQHLMSALAAVAKLVASSAVAGSSAKTTKREGATDFLPAKPLRSMNNATSEEATNRCERQSRVIRRETEYAIEHISMQRAIYPLWDIILTLLSTLLARLTVYNR